MKTMMTKTGLRFTVSTARHLVVLSAQVTPGGTFYQWLLTPEDVRKLASDLLAGVLDATADRRES